MGQHPPVTPEYGKWLVRTGWMLAGLALGWLGWYGIHRHDGLAWLPSHQGAGWWTVPREASAVMHRPAAQVCTFRAEFPIVGMPDHLELRVAVFRQGVVYVNGVKVEGLRLDGVGWKHPQKAEIAPFLRHGLNELVVTVTNNGGPPAIWAAWGDPLDLDPGSLQWQVISESGQIGKAHPANQPLPRGPGSYLQSFHTLPTLAARAVPVLALASGAALGLGLTLARFLRRLRGGWPRCAHRWGQERFGDGCLLVLTGVAWLVLFLNNLPQLPRIYGFDAEGHEAYIRYIQEQGRLPLAHEGWQMYQPPLYYLGAAALLEMTGLTVEDEAAVILLRACNGLVGWLHAVAVFWLLRLLYPDARWKARVGLLWVNALGAHLVVSHYVTNEPLAALCVTVGLALILHARRLGSPPGWAIAAGGMLGLAMLAKFSTLLAVPFVMLLGWLAPLPDQPPERRPVQVWRERGRAFILASLAFVLVCGWHYGRVWLYYGRPLVGNWDVEGLAGWWQEPGYRTAADYLRFGEALLRPWFSSFHGFWDGLYGTLWGDGLASGAAWMAFRPPWNESWMAVAWWLGAFWSLLITAGAMVVLGRSFVRGHGGVELLGPVLLVVYLGGLLYMSVRVASYAQVKAFYALPALGGLAIALVAGWEWLENGSRWRRGMLTGMLLLGWLSGLGGFWVHRNHVQTAVVQAIWALDQGDLHKGVQWLEQALARDPTWPELLAALAEAIRVRPREPELRHLYAVALESQGLWREALEHRRETVRLAPHRPEWLNNLAWLLATVPEPGLRSPREAVELAQKACELSGWHEPIYLGTLAAALASAGQFTEAVQRAEQASEIARQQGRHDVVRRNQELLELYRARRTVQWAPGPPRR